jgi:hypothetical protein
VYFRTLSQYFGDSQSWFLAIWDKLIDRTENWLPPYTRFFFKLSLFSYCFHTTCRTSRDANCVVSRLVVPVVPWLAESNSSSTILQAAAKRLYAPIAVIMGNTISQMFPPAAKFTEENLPDQAGKVPDRALAPIQSHRRLAD